MQRGEKGMGFIVLVVIAIVALFSFIALNLNKPTANLVNIENFYRPDNSFCNTVVCPSGQIAYHLGYIGDYAKCCCPGYFSEAPPAQATQCRFEVRVPIQGVNI